MSNDHLELADFMESEAELLQATIRVLVERVETLEKNNLTLLGLIQCTECSDELGQGNPAGWMPGLCPGCQAANYFESDTEALNGAYDDE